MAFTPAKMESLLVPSGPQDKLHLHVILTDRCADGQHLLAPISSINPQKAHDPACILGAGEHPFLDHPSYVLYRLMFRPMSFHLVNCVERGLFVEKEPFELPVFSRIGAGVAASKFAAKGMKTYFNDNN